MNRRPTPRRSGSAGGSVRSLAVVVVVTVKGSPWVRNVGVSPLSVGHCTRVARPLHLRTGPPSALCRPAYLAVMVEPDDSGGSPSTPDRGSALDVPPRPVLPRRRVYGLPELGQEREQRRCPLD